MNWAFQNPYKSHRTNLAFQGSLRIPKNPKKSQFIKNLQKPSKTFVELLKTSNKSPKNPQKSSKFIQGSFKIQQESSKIPNLIFKTLQTLQKPSKTSTIRPEILLKSYQNLKIFPKNPQEYPRILKDRKPNQWKPSKTNVEAVETPKNPNDPR